MNQALIKAQQGEYIPAEWDGTDTSGIWVVGKTVLVLMDAFSGKTSGGIEIPDDMAGRYSEGAETGVLVSKSGGAFLINEDGSPWSGYTPKPGDRVFVGKWAGTLVRGQDKRTYRIMDYGNVGAVYRDTKEKQA